MTKSKTAEKGASDQNQVENDSLQAGDEEQCADGTGREKQDEAEEDNGEPVRETRRTAFGRARLRLRKLYHGQSPAAVRFQAVILCVDLAIIALFVVSPIIRGTEYFLPIDYAVAVILAADLGARAVATRNLKRWARQPFVLLDVLILITLVFPETFINFGFLRIVRLWSLSRSGMLWRPLRRSSYSEYELALKAIVNLVTFLFLATGFIYTFFFRQTSGLEGYLDALYFTVASVTTTGYGDITLDGPGGKLTSIIIMIIGISLFFNLAQAVFKPPKVQHQCPNCGLQRHDPDAVHCKACGEQLNIPNPEG
ncbi:ion transporter [Fulvimarina pelagi HTCC2506]|uniref:Ion transporter n=1 Tax=Fulvimarina pelagi HTCC2506 TaxID=314231 RepID=Q0G3I8_9HYPH|nr:ion channel [Fulvimarina pelagi]EAU41843.1 ion transporter [Fulvimarina pelagi HTCC2506]